MPDQRITELSQISTIDNANDPILVVDVSDQTMDATGTNKKISVNQILGAGASIVTSAGTAAAPAITPTGDSNTGVYFPAADTVGVVTGGVAAITVNSSQQVGIGTGSPSSYGGTATIVGAAATGVLNVSSSNTGGAADIGGSIQLGGNDGVSGTRGYSVIRGFKENATSGDYASYLSFGTRANLGSITERLRIDSAGRVGIGVSNPASIAGSNTLSVVAGNQVASSGTINAYSNDTGGAADLGGSIAFGGHDGASTYRTYGTIVGKKENATSGNYASYLAFTTRANGGGMVEQMRINSAGQVGIGITSPSTIGATVSIVSANSSSGQLSVFTSDVGVVDTGGSIQFGGNDGSQTYRGWGLISCRKENSNSGNYASYMTFQTRGAGVTTERLRIDSTGQVGIGKTPTLGLLDVAADAYFNTVRVGLGNGGVSTNTAVGANTIAGASVTGARNVGVGSNSLNALSSGNDNVAVGRSTLSSVTSASNNTAIGAFALAPNTASDNTAVGYQALTLNTTGNLNTAVGRSALASNQTGARNTGIGYGALFVSTASDNTAVGYYGLNGNTTGTDNVAVGRSALEANQTGSNCVAVGRSALAANTASDNTAVGYASLTLNSSGTANVAVGRSAGASNTTGSSNTIVGRSAYNTASTGSFNTAIGHNSLSAATTSNDNTAVGYLAGNVLTTGASNTIIGSDADASGATGTGQIVIGKGVTGTANNRITVGITTNIAELDLDGVDTSWAASSDERLKKNVADYAAGLDVITALRPVTYQWRSRKEVPTELTNYYADSDEPVHGDASKTYHGFIAQEVKAVLDANPSVPNGQHLWEQRDDGVQTLAPADLVPILVNAIKQLNAEVQALKNK